MSTPFFNPAHASATSSQTLVAFCYVAAPLQTMLAKPHEAPGDGRRLKKNDSCEESRLMLEASGRVVDPAAIKNGSLLLSLAEEHIKGYWTLFPDQEFGPQLTSTDCKIEELSLSWGSCCSGSEGAFYVFEALNSVFESHDVRLSLRHKFSCESHQDKQKWIQAVVKCGPLDRSLDGETLCIPEEAGSPCIFANIAIFTKVLPIVWCTTRIAKCHIWMCWC